MGIDANIIRIPVHELAVLLALEELQLTFIEQPFSRWPRERLRDFSQRTSIPLARSALKSTGSGVGGFAGLSFPVRAALRARCRTKPCDSSHQADASADRVVRTARSPRAVARPATSTWLGDRHSNHGHLARLVKHWRPAALPSSAARAGLGLNELGVAGSNGTDCGLRAAHLAPSSVSPST